MKIPAAYIIDKENKKVRHEDNFIQLPIPEYDELKPIQTQSIEPPSTTIIIDL